MGKDQHYYELNPLAPSESMSRCQLKVGSGS